MTRQKQINPRIGFARAMRRTILNWMPVTRRQLRQEIEVALDEQRQARVTTLIKEINRRGVRRAASVTRSWQSRADRLYGGDMEAAKTDDAAYWAARSQVMCGSRFTTPMIERIREAKEDAPSCSPSAPANGGTA